MRLLGKFEISDGRRTLTQEEIRSGRVTKLAAYLMVNARKGVAFSQLIEELWTGGQSDNPVNALKNVMYRLRKALSQVWPGERFFLTLGGQYQWNTEIPLQTDVDVFDTLCRQAGLGDREEKWELLAQAIELYRGKFLMDYSDEHWIFYAQTHYHRKYLSAVLELAEHLEQERNFGQLERLCAKALVQEPYDERIHQYLFKAYMGENLLHVAERHYRAMEQILMEQMGMEPSKETRELFNLLMQHKHRRECDLTVIEEELLQERQNRGACRCTYSEFRKIYELESRRKDRVNSAITLCRITMTLQDERETDWKEMVALGLVMDELESIIVSALRTEDVVTRYSDCEFLVMLPDCELKDLEKIKQRIRKRTDTYRNRWKKILIQYSAKDMG